jgi:hypothetical protein
MNDEIMEELQDIYQAAFVKAGEIIDFAFENCAFESTSEDHRQIASSLFIEYNRRISPQYKGTRDQHEKGNNDGNPASIAQIKLIKTLVMAGGAQTDPIMRDFREAYGLEEKENFAELAELKMGQASDIITRLKELKPNKR